MAEQKIRHEWCKDNVASLCRKVDEVYGGWPKEAEGLVMQHSFERECYFSRGCPHDEWNTTVLTRKQYEEHKAKTPANDNPLSTPSNPTQQPEGEG